MPQKRCGKTKKYRHKRETWWWSKEGDSAVSEKRRSWKAWKQGGNKEPYFLAKRMAKRSVYAAKKTAEEQRFVDLRSGKTDVFKIAKQMRRENQDVIGDNCVKEVTFLLTMTPRKLLGNNIISVFLMKMLLGILII